MTRVIPEGARPDDPHFITIDPLLPDIRNNRRALVDDPERASALWERTRPLPPGPTLCSEP